ncbi:MAG: glycosyl transferase family 28, partial [Chitinophagaceae bacterium]|nr:glycosyl transferase family 28 [Chitinophagaceae bacterium]
MGSIKNLIKFNTNQEKNDKIPGKPRILVAPLDWGLGHATRCIPVIQALLHLDCELWLAGEGSVERVLRAEFPQLPFLQLKGYNIHYSRSA